MVESRKYCSLTFGSSDFIICLSCFGYSLVGMLDSRIRLPKVRGSLGRLDGQRIVAVFCIDASMSCFAAGATQSNVSAPFSTPIKYRLVERGQQWRGLCSGSSRSACQMSPNKAFEEGASSPYPSKHWPFFACASSEVFHRRLQDA